MASAFSHIAIPLCVGLVIKEKKIPYRLIFLGMLLSIFPDADIIGFKFGIRYEEPLGHRGITHSFFFCFLLSLALSYFHSKFDTTKIKMFVMCFLSLASHLVLDSFTNGGLGVAAFWPITNERYFSPWKFIEVSPLSPSAFFSQRGIEIIKSEILTIWLPCLLVTFGYIFAFKRKKPS